MTGLAQTATRRLPKPYTAAELRALESAITDPVLRSACEFLGETGLRISEFLAIGADQARTWPRPGRWCRRCRRHRAILRVCGKGGRERMVPLTPAALRAAWVMLPRSNGTLLPWPERTFRFLIARAGSSVGVHAHPHRWRHTFATRLVESGAPIEVVADLMGHSSVNVTRLYYAMSEARAFSAVARPSARRGRRRRRGS